MATNDGYAPYPLNLTAEEARTAIHRAFNLGAEFGSYKFKYKQATMPVPGDFPAAGLKSGDSWENTADNKVYNAFIVDDSGVTLWLEV